MKAATADEVLRIVREIELTQNDIRDRVTLHRAGGRRQCDGDDQQAQRCEFPKSRFELHSSPIVESGSRRLRSACLRRTRSMCGR
jgi:hypothetical protein